MLHAPTGLLVPCGMYTLVSCVLKGQDGTSNTYCVSCVVSVLCCAGDKVVTFRYGQFSHLWIDMMQRLGLDVTVIDRPWGEGADEAILQVRDRRQARTDPYTRGLQIGRWMGSGGLGLKCVPAGLGSW